MATEGRLGGAGEGGSVATIVDKVSSFLSNSRSLLGSGPSPRAFAGRLRATCSTHSTLAFWHLGTCHLVLEYFTDGRTYLWQILGVSERTQRT